jgi:hypothetical protein
MDWRRLTAQALRHDERGAAGTGSRFRGHPTEEPRRLAAGRSGGPALRWMVTCSGSEQRYWVQHDLAGPGRPPRRPEGRSRAELGQQVDRGQHPQPGQEHRRLGLPGNPRVARSRRARMTQAGRNPARSLSMPAGRRAARATSSTQRAIMTAAAIRPPCGAALFSARVLADEGTCHRAIGVTTKASGADR